jgi:hypothetical protein
MAPPKDTIGDDSDWRMTARPKPGGGISRTFSLMP